MKQMIFDKIYIFGENQKGMFENLEKFFTQLKLFFLIYLYL